MWNCQTGQSIAPHIDILHLHTLELGHCALPALSFVSPGLLYLKVTFSHDRSLPKWWVTCFYPITTPSHHEVIHVPHFPKLRTLVVNASLHNEDFREPQAILIRAHPGVSSLWIVGYDGAEGLLCRAFGREALGVTYSQFSDSDALLVPSVPSSDQLSIPTALQLLTLDMRIGRASAGNPTTLLSLLALAGVFLEQSTHLHLRIIAGPLASSKGPYGYDPMTSNHELVVKELERMKVLFKGRCQIVRMDYAGYIEWRM